MRNPDVEVNGHRYVWEPGTRLEIGRDPACDIVLDDPKVSRVHATLEATADGAWRLVDARSTNGTWVDGRRVGQVVIGSSETVSLGGAGNGVVIELSLLSRPDEETSITHVPVAPAPEAPETLATPVTPVTPVTPARGSPAVQASPPPSAPPPSAPAPAPPPSAPALAPPGTATSFGRLSSVYEPTGSVVTIGRDPASDIVLADDPRASRHHAELRLGSDGSWVLKDVGSHNGTFLNGERVSQAFLSDGDIVAAGNHLYRFRQGKLEEFSAADDTSLDVARLKVVTEGGMTLVEDVAFSLPSRSVLAIVGPSGAGKTTLLRALNGFSAPTEGGVRFAGRDLYGAYEELRSRIGYVPQDDLVHPQLTIRQELDSAAALRLPPDLGKQGRNARVERVIDELGLAQRANLRIENLSGGQRKRASLAIELLTEPALLFLDEPTSGLDPGNEHQVMSVLRELADRGRIVIVVTHATQSLNLVDRVLFLTRGGHVAYYGPPEKALAYFARYGVTGGYAEIFRLLEAPDVDNLAARFRADADHDRYVDRALRQADVALWVTHGGRARAVSPVTPARQLAVLVHRQLRILRGDKRTLALLALQAPLFGLIIAFLFPGHTMSTTQGPFAALMLWLLVVSATWLGASNSIREIVKELPLYRRERAVGLSIPAYLGSKALVFGTITVVQSIVLVLIGFSRQSLPPQDSFNIIPLVNQEFPGLLSGLRPLALGSVFSSQMLEIIIAVALSGLAGMALGLAISARVQRSDQAVLSLPIVLVVQMTLSLPLLQAQNPSPFLKVLGDLTGANWGMKAVASTTSLNQLMTSYLDSLTIGNAEIRQLVGRPYPTPYIREQLMSAAVGTSSWRHTAEPWLFAIGILILMMVVFMVAAWYFLRRIDIGRRRPPHSRR